MEQEELKSALRRMVLKDILPELKAARTRLARVTNIHTEGGIGNLFRRRWYAVDLEVLDKEGEVDIDFDQLLDIELPQIWAKGVGGVFARPEVGAIYRIGFDNLDENQPYIISGTSRGNTRVPVGEAGTYGVYFSKKVKWLIDRVGNFIFETNRKITTRCSDQETVVNGSVLEQSGTRQIETGDLNTECSGSSTEEVMGEKSITVGCYTLGSEGDLSMTAGGNENCTIIGERSTVIGEGDKTVILTGDQVVELKTGGLITNLLIGDIKFEITAGDVIFKAVAGDINLETTAGNINFKATTGDINLETVAGRHIVKNTVVSQIDLFNTLLDLVRDLTVIGQGTAVLNPAGKLAVEQLRMQFGALYQ